jgi:hypothetical protein
MDGYPWLFHAPWSSTPGKLEMGGLLLIHHFGAAPAPSLVAAQLTRSRAESAAR